MKEQIPDGLLRRYLQGTLSQTEREQFEKQLDDDHELVETLAMRRAEMAASELLVAADTREWIQEWRRPETNRFFGKGIVWWLVAMVAGIALVVFAIFMLQRPATDTPQIPSPPQTVKEIAANPVEDTVSNHYLALAERYAEKPVLSGTRQLKAGESSASVLRQAQASFAAGEFQQTLDLLSQTDKAQFQSATFLEAHALFQLRRFGEASDRFSRLIESNSRQYRYSSEWGLLMCRLAEFPQQEPQVRRQLRDILANPQHPYFEQAKKLQTELKE